MKIAKFHHGNELKPFTKVIVSNEDYKSFDEMTQKLQECADLFGYHIERSFTRL